MHYADIQASIKKAGTTQAAIARDLGVSPTAVANVIRGKKSYRIAKAISAVVGIPVSRLWPGTYPRRKRKS